MDMKEIRYAWMNGQFVPWGEAKVHINSSCVTEGCSVFEGIRAYWNASEGQLYLFKAKEHLQRLHQSARMMRMTPQYTPTELESAVLELISKNDYREVRNQDTGTHCSRCIRPRLQKRILHSSGHVSSKSCRACSVDRRG